MKHVGRLVGALGLVATIACAPASGVAAGGRPRVVASVYPLVFVVEEVGGDLVALESLTPPGAEPHDLELTAGEVRAVAAADLVVYIGDGFQPTVEEAIQDIDAGVVDVLDTQDALLSPSEHEDEEDHEGDAHEERAADPHVWLDPQRLGGIARVVGERLVELDPDNAARFRANTASLRSRLRTLDQEFRRALSRCEQQTIVTSHEAFGYLADAYGLEEIGIACIDPEVEPSPRRLAEVARFVERNDVSTVFFEVLVPAQTAQTLADEVGIEIARLDPLEGPPARGDYFTAMRANLAALRQGLGCG